MNRDRNKKPPEPTIQPSTWFTMKQAAQYMGCTERFVERLCQSRRIQFAELGHRYVLKREDMDAFVESMKRPALRNSLPTFVERAVWEGETLRAERNPHKGGRER